jgi:hypothetical protein
MLSPQDSAMETVIVKALGHIARFLQLQHLLESRVDQLVVSSPVFASKAPLPLRYLYHPCATLIILLVVVETACVAMRLERVSHLNQMGLCAPLQVSAYQETASLVSAVLPLDVLRAKLVSLEHALPRQTAPILVAQLFSAPTTFLGGAPSPARLTVDLRAVIVQVARVIPACQDAQLV